jgi:primase-polymerase (primpol)-like protein
MPDGRPAKANDPDTWVDFDSAMRAAEARNWGLGIMLGGGIVGVDCDSCVGADGSIEHWAH